ncbi:MAG: winged helix-turn-helix domain-containing protein [Muribaculaceae bacterium]|nr:winged helix-turn-helix domain-containing protein [Muribaculaceae bacterium]
MKVRGYDVTKVKTRFRIVDMMCECPKVTELQMSKEIGISEKAIQKQVKKLRGRGIIRRIGSARAGYWEVIAPPK